MKMCLSALTFLAAIVLLIGSARADTFGTGANQFTLDFVPISGSSNPTEAQANDASRSLDGHGIVEYDYRMGVHEITNDQWNKFVASYGMPTGNPSSAYNGSPFGTTDVPTNYVSWYEAAQFVNWLNTSTGHQPAYKFTGTQGHSYYTFVTWGPAEAWSGTNPYRHKDAFYFLPDRDEWFKAAYWNGANIQDRATKASDTLHQGDGSSGTGWNYYDSENGGYATDSEGMWDVGSGSEELNGTHDMMGNIAEWLESSAWGEPSPGQSRVVRGGNYRGSSYEFNAEEDGASATPNSETYWIGFRVASVAAPVPEPSTFALLAMAAVGLAVVWWRRRSAFSATSSPELAEPARPLPLTR